MTSAKHSEYDYLYKIFIKTAKLNDSVLYIVKIGPINNNENALYVQRRLKNDEISSKIIKE